MAYDFDLFVIGAGSGGVRASRMAAKYGARVAVAENRYLGGTCVNVGCVPKKLFVYGSHFAEEFEDARGYGFSTAPPEFNWATLRDNKTREIERLNGIYANLLDSAGVKTLRGTARLTDAHHIEIDGQTVSAERVLIATGSWPYIPDFPGAEHVISSNEAFYLDQFPRRALVVGGGYIAVEFAGIFAGLGAATTLSYRGPLFLRGFDDGVREFVADELRNKHVDLRFDSHVESISVLPDGSREVRLRDGGTLVVDLVLYATGRRPNVAGLGLAQAGVALGEHGAVIVDDEFRTNVPNIFAIGDVIDRVQLTPVAINEAMALTENLFKGGKRRMSYENIPTAVFCQPNIGTVGLTEAQARERFKTISVFESRFRPMKHTLSGRQEKTLMKLIVDVATDRVVGAHMVGPDAGEITQGLGVALIAGATKAQFDATIGIHPTAAEEFVTMREPVR
ncbi:MAG: glutathione-disulfide reductase [Gammaproteobacteria bacterium]|nr:glutathione-disulfide reductase [Gammaproteobacteria bacterium]